MTVDLEATLGNSSRCRGKEEKNAAASATSKGKAYVHGRGLFSMRRSSISCFSFSVNTQVP